MVKERARRFFGFAGRVAERMGDPYYQGTAAELGFYFLFSLLPLVILLGQVMGFFSVSGTILTKLIGSYVDPEFALELGRFLNYQPSGTLSAILLVLTLWSASQAQFALIRISNYSYEHRLEGFRKAFLRERIRAAYTTALMVFMLGFSLLVLVYGEMLAKLAVWSLQRFWSFDLQISDYWYLLRWPAGVAVMFPVLSYNYHAFPHVRLPYRKVLPGSLFASVAILLITWAYSAYAVQFSSYNLLYGSMATFVTMMFWFYLVGLILVIGIQINIVRDQDRGERSVPQEGYEEEIQ